ncbi:MAG: S46 family peptidase [Bacteroidales bacterium]|nr:S46 family peptidase [Bacteroidales bacterium]
MKMNDAVSCRRPARLLIRLGCAALAFVLTAGQAFADEGMWLLPLIQKMNGKALKEAGCRLTPEEIYSVNHSSLKDAIVQFGGGCTGEIVSDEGLLLTNHHCGYSSIQKLSSVEHDYLKDGYWAMKRSEELPCPGLTVTFLVSMTDVTESLEKVEKKVRKECEDPAAADGLVAAALKESCEAMEKAVAENTPGCTAEVTSFYNGNAYYLIVYRTFRDVRFVGAPPSSIGKFGADTDNWMWPRHTCDFSMFRVYADKDNMPADYSEDNVPYTPERSLRISLKGVKEGDFTMIMGYPGRTTRFQTSDELEEQLRVNDIRIAARTIRQDIMMDYMLKDPAVKIQYASKYSGSSNGWKKWKGMKLAFARLGIIDRARAEEAEFGAWVDGNAKRKALYGNALADIRTDVECRREATEAYVLASETIGNIELVRFVNASRSKKRPLGPEMYKDYCPALDRDVASAMVSHYRENADGKYSLKEEFDLDSIFHNSVYLSYESYAAADSATLADDPAVAFADAVMDVLWSSYSELRSDDISTVDAEKARKAYTAGLLEWRKGEPSYPDANFTMRLTYGKVLPYSPRDAVLYRHYTTLDGVMEKEDPDNWEFVVPARLKELWKSRDFGAYAMEDGRMPACFLSNNDITGGNSGSPIMNADGELIGLAFDGNWESMSSDVMFEPDLQRCINVDIRYVLFIIDKFGGAGWLLDEMDIVK